MKKALETYKQLLTQKTLIYILLPVLYIASFLLVNAAIDTSSSITSNDSTILESKEVSSTPVTLSEQYPPVTGERTVAVILVNFLDDQDEPGTPEKTLEIMSEVSDYFEEVSYGAVHLSTDVYGWWTLPFDTSRCTEQGSHLVGLDIKKEAIRRGVNLSPYNHVIFVFNKRQGSWCKGGLGTVMGGQGMVWLTWEDTYAGEKTSFDSLYGISRIVHEIGHNLGLKHANRLDCGETTFGDSCTTIGYGDFYDAMGTLSQYRASHFNAFQKMKLGWISDAQDIENRIQTITEDGEYFIDTYETPGGIKALRFPRGPGIKGGTDYYYIEYRQPIGWDTELKEGTHTATNGVLVHLGNDTIDNSSRLLDMQPTNTTGHELLQRNTFKDTETGVEIQLLDTSTKGATVRVRLAE